MGFSDAPHSPRGQFGYSSFISFNELLPALQLDLGMLPTLVLLPGMDGTGELFASLLAQLGGETRSIVVRYPTCEFLNYDALTEVVKAQLPDGESFVLLAESFSGPCNFLGSNAARTTSRLDSLCFLRA